MRRVVVTGATGFIGSALCARLVAHGEQVTALVNQSKTTPAGVRAIAIGDGLDAAQWRTAFAGCDAIVHLAARTHRGEQTDPKTRAAFWQTNVELTHTLVEHAITAGVPHFVFMSSSKVHGEVSPQQGPLEWLAFSPSMAPAPRGPYGESKLQAEQLLATMTRLSSTGVTILRPPLVYGPGMRGNLLTLMGAIARGIPLPFGSIVNRRSLVGRDHLVDALLLALNSPHAELRIYTLADCAQSTPELITSMAHGLGREPRIWRCPVSVLRALGRAGGVGAQVARLTDSMVLDASAIERELGWTPRIDLTEPWREIGQWYTQIRQVR